MLIANKSHRPGPVGRMRVRLACRRSWVRQHPFVETGHEIISMVILSLIQVGQLSNTGEKMYT